MNRKHVIFALIGVFLVLSIYFIVNREYTKKEEEQMVLVDLPTRIPPRINATYNQKIPLRIVQTNTSTKIPRRMNDAIMTFVNQNPEYEYVYYDDEGARNVVREYSERALKCYDKVIPGAYKADIFRYCELALRGGVYLDSCFESIEPLRNFIEQANDIVVCFDDNRMGLYNAFIASTPNNPIITTTIDIVCDRVEKEEYGVSDLSITGPYALYDGFLATMNKGNYKMLVMISNQELKTGTIFSGRTKVINTKYPGYKQDIRRIRPNIDYGPMYKNKSIFRK